MKGLIVLSHPNIENSVVNKRFLKEAAAQSFAVRDLAREYPSGEIDGERERAIIKAHDALVLQFPLHNFSSPAILKSWIDATLRMDLPTDARARAFADAPWRWQ